MKPLFLFSILLIFCIHIQAQDKIIPVKATELIEGFKKEKGVVVINFWSTWCKPCLDEIPHFLELVAEEKEAGVKLWLVSQDTKELFQNGKLKAFLEKNNWKPEKSFWFNETNADYYCPLIDKDWSGVIPATVIINNKKKYYRFFEEALSKAELKREIELAK